MLRFASVFLLTILVISHIQSQITDIDTTEETNPTDTQPTDFPTSITPFDFSTDSNISTASISEESTTVTLSSTDFVTENDTTSIDLSTTESLSSESTAETTEETSTALITSTTTTSVTTEPPVTPFFYCDFTNSSCFGDGQLTVTDGSEFDPTPLSSDTPPPRAPTSDVTSITELTSNGEICVLPYQPYLDNSTEANWNISFCYNQTCPTEHGEGICAEGYYGLISLNASETSKTISNPFYSPTFLRDSVFEQLLEFYYYFTVYEDRPNWGQQMQIWLKPDNQLDDRISLLNLTINDMKENAWQSRNLRFQSPSENYTLEFVFQIEDGASDFNETINFALDNIALYNIKSPLTTETSTDVTNTGSDTSTTSVTTTTTTITTTTAAPSDLGKTIGLSLGIGIPVLLIVVGGIILYQKKKRTTVNYDIPLTSTRPQKDSDIFDNPLLF